MAAPRNDGRNAHRSRLPTYHPALSPNPENERQPSRSSQSRIPIRIPRSESNPESPNVHDDNTQPEQKLQQLLKNETTKREEVEKERDKALKERDKALKEKDKILEDRDNTLEETDNALEDRENALEERDNALKKMDSALEERDKALEERDNALLSHSEQQDINSDLFKLTDGADADMRKLRGENIASQAQVGILEGEKEALQVQVGILEEANLSLQGEKEALQVQVRILEEANRSLQDEASLARNQAQDLQHQKQQLQEQVHESEQVIMTLKEANQRLQDESGVARNQVQDLQHQKRTLVVRFASQRRSFLWIINCLINPRTSTPRGTAQIPARIGWTSEGIEQVETHLLPTPQHPSRDPSGDDVHSLSVDRIDRAPRRKSRRKSQREPQREPRREPRHRASRSGEARASKMAVVAKDGERRISVSSTARRVRYLSWRPKGRYLSFLLRMLGWTKGHFQENTTSPRGRNY